MSSRILLADLSSPSGAFRKFFYPGFSQTLKGTSISCSQLRVETASAVSGGAAYTTPITGLSYAEFYIEDITSGQVSVGVSRNGENYNNAPGASALCAVLRSDGFYRLNAVTTAAAFGSYTTGARIGVFADVLTTPGQCRIWFSEGASIDSQLNTLSSPHLTITSGSGDFYFYAGGASSQFAINICDGGFDNFGQNSRVYDGRGFDNHLYLTSGADVQDSSVYRFSTMKFVTEAGDSPANTIYLPNILDEPDFSKDLGLSIWGARSTTSIGTLDIADPEGELDFLLRYSVRDMILTLYVVDENQTLAQRTKIATLIVDKIDIVDSFRKRLTLRDRSAALDVPLLNTVWSNAAPNTALRGRARPSGFGNPQQVELIPYDLANLVFDLGAESRGAFGSMRDQGLVVSTLTNAVTAEEPNGTKRTTAPAGVQTANYLMLRKLLPQLIGEAQGSEFSTWTGDNPNGWTVTETAPNNIVTQLVAGRARFLSNGAANVSITQSPGINTTTDRLYWEINITSYTSGTLELVSGGTVISTFNAVGIWKGWRVFSLIGTDITLRLSPGVAGDLQVEYARFWKVGRTDDPIHAIPYLVADKGGFAESDIVSADYTNLPADLQNEQSTQLLFLAQYYDSPVNVSDAVTSLCDSMLAGWYIDNDSKFRFVLWDAPRDSMTSVFSFDQSNVVQDSLTVEFDDLSGLATDVRYQRNFRPLTDAEFAGAVSAADRQTLREEYQFVERATSRVADCYKSSIGKLFDSCISSSFSNAVTRGLAYRLREIAALPRYFYRFKAYAYDETMFNIKLGDIVSLHYRNGRHYLQGADTGLGKKLRVKKISGKYGVSELEFVLWG